MAGVADQISRDGWAVLPGAFTRVECQAIAEAAAERPFPELPPALMRWVADPRWAEWVMPVIGPEVRLLRAQMLAKRPSPTRWCPGTRTTTSWPSSRPSS